MEIKVDDLVNFCAYYTLTKNATKLPHSSNPPQRTKIDKRPIKSKKVEVIQSKRTKKPKMEHMTASNKIKSSVSPVHKHAIKQIASQTKNKNLDINSFISHLASQNSQPNTWHEPSKNRGFQQIFQVAQKKESNLSNYQTFGKSSGKPIEFETFQDKMRKQGRYNLTDRAPKEDRYDWTEHAVSHFALRPEQKQSQLTQNNLWMTATQKAFKSQFIDFDGKKSQNYGSHLDNMNYQQTQSKISYSPIKRQFTPTNSQISSSKYSPSSHLSKSRSKHQRKKSQRPFYDASKLTVKKQTQSVVRDNFEQNTLSQSFVTVEETSSISIPTKKVTYDQGKRETSTTAPPLRGNRQLKKIVRIDRNQTDLDDALGQTLTQLSHRKAPISIDIKMRGDS